MTSPAILTLIGTGVALAADSTRTLVEASQSFWSHLASVGDSADGSSSTAPALFDLAEAKRISRSELDDFAHELRGQMWSRGISAHPPIQIDFDAQGQPRVVGNHPQRGEIEAWLAADLRLGELLERVLVSLESWDRSARATSALPRLDDTPLQRSRVQLTISDLDSDLDYDLGISN